MDDEVLILRPDSTASRLFSRWKGPAKIVGIKSPYSYIVELDGSRYHLHANDLRRYYVKAEMVQYTPLAFTDSEVTSACDIQTIPDEDGDVCDKVIEALSFEKSMASVATCAIVHDEDDDFGSVQTVDPEANQT
jgi:hypothetical protein